MPIRHHPLVKALLLLGILITGLGPQVARAAPIANPLSPWQPGESIADRMQCTSNPVLDTDASGTVYAMWCDLSQAPNGYDVFLRYRTTSGSWSPIEDVSPTPDWNQERQDFEVTPNGDIYVVWRRKVLSPHPPESLIRFRKREADGTWGPVEFVANEEDEERSVEVVVDGTGNAYVVWDQYPFNGSYEDSVTKMRKRNSDGTWDAIETVAQGSVGSDDMIVDAQGNLYVLVRDISADQVYLHHRSPSGTWNGPTLIGDPGVDPADLGFGKDGKIYATLRGDDGSRALSYQASDGSWEPPIDLGHDGKWIKMIIDASGDGYAYWSKDNKIYTAYRWEDGTWSSPVYVDSRVIKTYPQLAMTPAGDQFFLIWEGAYEDLYFSSADAPGDEPDLSPSTKSTRPQDVDPGDRVDYVFTVGNIGKNTAFTLTDTLPLSTTLIGGSAWADEGAITATDRGITWTAVCSYSASIEAGFAVTLSSTLHPTATTVITNTAYLHDGANTLPLAHPLIVNPKRVYLPTVLRSH